MIVFFFIDFYLFLSCPVFSYCSVGRLIFLLRRGWCKRFLGRCMVMSYCSDEFLGSKVEYYCSGTLNLSEITQYINRTNFLSYMKSFLVYVYFHLYSKADYGHVIHAVAWPSGYGGSFRRYWETAWVRTPQLPTFFCIFAIFGLSRNYLWIQSNNNWE